MFTLAHFSDVHLAPLPPLGLANLTAKRLSGYLSWKLNRVRVHRPEILAAIMADIAAHAPDHLAFTGDLVNLALPAEIEAGAQWLETLGSPRDVTMVPGNHDAYTATGYAALRSRLAPWMSGDAGGQAFPFARYRRNIAILGLSSAIPTPIFQASGRLGRAQLERLASLLEETRAKGFARVVMLHHPPAPGLSRPRKALADAADLTAILAKHGAELVLYGHTHNHQSHVIEGVHGPVFCLGMPSASAAAHAGHPSAAWAKFTLRRQDGAWRVSASIRGYDMESSRIEPLRELSLGES